MGGTAYHAALALALVAWLVLDSLGPPGGAACAAG